jgi:carbamoyl-phosphate synthase small subunit
VGDPGQGHPIALRLANGMELQGQSFGARKEVSGEFVFATGMTGYVEMLTDPSYAGQILVLTYPLIGNYGVPNTLTRDLTGILKYTQSKKIQVKGLVVQNYTNEWSHYLGTKSLHEWLVQNDIPGIYGVDTREMTKTLRSHGSMSGKIGSKDRLDDIRDFDYTKESAGLVPGVSRASDLPIIFDKFPKAGCQQYQAVPTFSWWTLA